MDKSGVATNWQDYVSKIDELRASGQQVSMDMCQQLLEHAADEKSDMLFGLGYYYYAVNYWHQGENDRAMHCLTECSKYFQAARMEEYLAKTYNMMGAVSDRKNNPLVALNYYFTSQYHAENHKLYAVQGAAEHNIAFVLVRMKMYREAIQRYYKSKECYEKAEQNTANINYQITGMTWCAFCHIVLEETEQVFVLEKRVQKLLEKSGDISSIRENVWLFQAACEVLRGNTAQAEGLFDRILDALQEDCILEQFMDDVVILAALFDRTQDGARQERLMGMIPQEKLNKYLIVYLEIYPFKSRYLLRNNMMQEYVEYTKEYFRQYEYYQQERNLAVVKTLEMRKKIKSIEAEQVRMRVDNEYLEKIALRDSMTGLANRTGLNEHLASQFDQAFLQQELLGVEMLDIDYFKQFNDIYGHLQGDRCIEAVADILRSVQSDRVFCARYGGDEFMIVYSGMTTGEIRQVMEDIQEKVRRLAIPHKGSGCSEYVTVSQGAFARIPNEENREWDFNRAADKALYEAKEKGRNCFCIKTRF